MKIHDRRPGPTHGPDHPETLVQQLLTQYRRDGLPIDVDFREMVKLVGSPDRYTHLLHPYPAKLLQHIPYLFLNSSSFGRVGGTVLDPFSGSGTVLLEALLAGWNAVGVDSNPLASLISRVKISTPLERHLDEGAEKILSFWNEDPKCPPPAIQNLEYWFYPHIVDGLARIRSGIDRLTNIEVSEFYKLCLSVTVRKVSLANPRFAVPVRLRPENYPRGHWYRAKAEQRLHFLQQVSPLKVFEEVVETNRKRIARIRGALGGIGYVQNIDFRNVSKIHLGQADAIITSPPYAGAQKYIRSSGLELGWLEGVSQSELSSLRGSTIGREKFSRTEYRELKPCGVESADLLLESVKRRNALRACIAATYIREMRSALSVAKEHLYSGGDLLLVVGPTTVSGEVFDVPSYLDRILVHELGFNKRLELVDRIRTRKLMTKRNSSSSMIAKEHVVWYQKN